MKKYLPIFALVLSLSFLVLGSAGAQEATSTSQQATTTTSTIATPPSPSSTPAVPATKDVRKEDLRQELSIKEIRGRLVSGSGKPSAEISVKAGTISAISADGIRVSLFGQVFDVKIASDSKIVRQHWGESNLNEFSVGDIVNVFGFLNENNVILAKTIRNVSIQKVHNNFKGVIDSVSASSNSFVLRTEERGNQTVFVSASTSIINATSSASFSDLKVGMVVVARGVWDKTLSTVQASSVIIGRLDDPRANFLSPSLKEKMEKKFENKTRQIEKIRENAEKKIESASSTARLKIEELQKQIQDLLRKIGR